jgi:hypothetical protein
MKNLKKNNEKGYHDPHLLKTGLIAALGGLCIYTMIAWIGMALLHK